MRRELVGEFPVKISGSLWRVLLFLRVMRTNDDYNYLTNDRGHRETEKEEKQTHARTYNIKDIYYFDLKASEFIRRMGA